MFYRQALIAKHAFLSALCLWLFLSLDLPAQSVSTQKISFHSQIVPLLTRAGCNAGTCHGAAAGRGGLHLSLFGGSPSQDYQAIVHQMEGRRIHRVTHEKSLILRKPLGDLSHGGDQIFDNDSLEYKTLHAWVRQGATFDSPLLLTDFRVAVEQLQGSSEPTFQMKGLALVHGEESPLDVSAFTQITVTDPDSAKLNAANFQVQLLRPGRHIIIARYLDRIQAVTLTRPYPASIAHVQLTANNFIDREINETLSELNLPSGGQIGDAEFLRRATLDLTGRLPEPNDVNTFVSNQVIDKRQRIVDRLLSSAAFNDYWTLIVARWLRLHSLPNDARGAETFGKWIRQSIADGVSWRDMTGQLLTATGDSHAIGPANLSRMVGDARAHAELVSELFLGARMGCANCHDHPLDRWTQDDYHGLAAMLARIDRGRQVQFTTRGDVTNPKTSLPARWRLPGDRFVEADAHPFETLAQWLTQPDQTRLSRAFTNRIWSEMFGRGLVEAVDDMRETNPATHPELLDELAHRVAAYDYDLRSLLRCIAATEAYSRSSTDNPDSFYGYHESRQINAHVLADAMADVTGVPMSFQHMPFGTRAVQVLDPLTPAPALDVLGRCNRVAACVTTKTTTGLATQLHLINGELINRTLSDPDSRLMRLIELHSSTAEIINEFHSRAFGFPANLEQVEYWVQKLDSSDPHERTERLQDWLWSILSSQKFQLNR